MRLESLSTRVLVEQGSLGQSSVRLVFSASEKDGKGIHQHQEQGGRTVCRKITCYMKPLWKSSRDSCHSAGGNRSPVDVLKPGFQVGSRGV